MKHIIIIAVIVISCFTAEAQPAANHLFLGGDFSLYGRVEKQKVGGTSTTDQKSFMFSIMPMVGYFLSDRTAVGVQIGISSLTNKYPDNNLYKSTSFQFTFRPFARYYLIAGTGGLFAEASAGLSAGKSKSFYQGGDNEEFNGTIVDIGISPGVYYYITPKFAIEAQFGWIGFTSSVYKNGNLKDIDNGFGMNVSSSSLSFGFTYTIL